MKRELRSQIDQDELKIGQTAIQLLKQLDGLPLNEIVQILDMSKVIALQTTRFTTQSEGFSALDLVFRCACSE